MTTDTTLDGAIDLLKSAAETCANNAPINEARGDIAQAELERKLAEQYTQAARHLKAVAS